jgi:transcriptional regulator with XRE-family HTH domain
MRGFDLKTALYELKWTQAFFAERCGVDPDTVSRWATGKTPVPKLVIEYLRVMSQLKGMLSG